MITKAVRAHGSRVRGVVEYLFGPGRAEEHTNPHVVASHAGLLVGEQGESAWARKVLAGELDAYRVALAPEVTEKFVFHAAVSIAAEDGPLAEETWADVAETIAAHLGFTPQGDGPDVRWMAVHHGLSSNGNDHIHLVANLINSDGRKHRFPRPPGVMLGEVRKTLEIRHGLRQVGHTNGVDHGTGLGQHTRAEVERATRELRTLTPAGAGTEAGAEAPAALEPESVRLERTVRAAAAGADTEAVFVAELREQHVIVRPRMATGSSTQVVGYSVALPTGGGGERLLWFGGGRLAKDLTLPALRARWEHGQDDATVIAAGRMAAVEAWKPTGTVTEQRAAAVDHPERRDAEADLAVVRNRISALGQWAQTAGSTDPEVTREAARAAAGLLAAAATRLPSHQQVAFHQAARALARLGQPDRAGLRAVPGGRPTDHAASGPRVLGTGMVGAALLHAATGPHSKAGWLAVYQALATTTALVTIAHRSTEVARAEQDAAEAAARQVMALTLAGQRDPAPARRNLDTSFPIPLHEQLAHARRTPRPAAGPSTGNPPVPGRDRDTGPEL